MILIIFQVNDDKPDIKNYSYPCRIIQVKEDEYSLNELEIKIRCYFSSGSKRFIKDKDDGQLEFSDFWLKSNEFAKNFK